MGEAEIRTVKRLAHEMLQVSHEQLDMSFFMGLGYALAIAYEESTGRTAADKKPQELIQWALGLPEVRFKKVGS
jgi:phosphoribosylaminoimidazole (AIR) synthetase